MDMINEAYKTADLLEEAQKPEPVRPALQPKKPIPNVKVCFQRLFWRQRYQFPGGVGAVGIVVEFL